MRTFVIALAVLGLAAVALAADASGTWKAEYKTPDGTQRTNTFTLKVDGAKLTGTIKGASDETPLTNGVVSRDEISFTADRPFGKFSYKGKVSGDEIQFQVQFNDNNFSFTAKRVGK